MDENLLVQEETQTQNDLMQEPLSANENSALNNSEIKESEGGQSQDLPEENLILGKFKTIEDLSKAYQELEKHQGMQSEELGALRKQCSNFTAIENSFNNMKTLLGPAAKELQYAKNKYNSENYFQNPSFNEMYKAAFMALGDNLDSDKFINLLETYVNSRIFAHEKSKTALKETESIINSMTFSDNKTSSITPPVKRLDEMTPKEVDDLLERLI